MSLVKVLDFLRVGEDGGGTGGGVTTLEPPASAPEPPASDPEPPASDPEDAPAGDDGQPPADPEVTPPADELTEDDWAALYEKYPDRDPNRVKDEARKQVQQELQSKPERVKAQDPFFTAIRQQADDSYSQIANSLRKLNEGELEDAGDLMAHIAVTGAFQAASERRGHIDVNRAVLERALGMENGLTQGDPIHDQYDAALTSLETAQQNAYRLRGQAVREYDPQKRAALITKAEVMDAEAVGNFYHQSINLALEKGKADGKADAEKTFTKRAPVIAEKARANGQTEAIAKARQTLAAGRAMSSGSGPSQPTVSDPAKLNARVAYGVDSDGTKVTQADRDEFRKRYPG